MSYQDVVEMVNDWDLHMRLVACAAQEQPDDPAVFVEDNAFRICAQPGWDAAWASATAGKVTTPGRDPGVITDEMILSGMQAVVQTVTDRAEQAAEAAAQAVTAQRAAERQAQIDLYTKQCQIAAEYAVAPPPDDATDPPPDDKTTPTRKAAK